MARGGGCVASGRGIWAVWRGGARGRHYGRMGGRVTRSLARLTEVVSRRRRKIEFLCRALPSLRCCFPFFHLYFCTSRNAFNMKRQQARTGSAIRREREGDRDIGRTGEALRCQPSQAKLRQAGRLARLARTMPKRAS